MRRHRGSGSAFRELDTWIWRGDSTFPAGLDPTLLSGAQLVPWQLCCEILLASAPSQGFSRLFCTSLVDSQWHFAFKRPSGF